MLLNSFLSYIVFDSFAEKGNLATKLLQSYSQMSFLLGLGFQQRSPAYPVVISEYLTVFERNETIFGPY